MEPMVGSGERLPDSEGYAAFDEERWAAEPPKSRNRTAFERDRARLIHSSALRRLGAKSQVLVAGTDDFARTRLTHTLEVAQIGRQIAAMLGCDPDVVDCACLAHDLGHPPFGHNGEKALATIAAGIGGFEGNAQTLRLLTRLEPKIFHDDGRSAGVNLTRASLDAAVKYPWTYAEAVARGGNGRSVKFCVYPDDVDVFRWLKQGAPAGAKPMECQVMDLSDDIAYSVHDVEDAIATGAFNPIVLADSRIVDRIVEITREWYGERWDPDLLVAALEAAAARAYVPGAFQRLQAGAGAAEEHHQHADRPIRLVGGARDPRHLRRRPADQILGQPGDPRTDAATRSWRSRASPCTSSWRRANANRSIRRSSASWRIWWTCSWPTRRVRATRSELGVPAGLERGHQRRRTACAWSSTRWPA